LSLNRSYPFVNPSDPTEPKGLTCPILQPKRYDDCVADSRAAAAATSACRHVHLAPKPTQAVSNAKKSAISTVGGGTAISVDPRDGRLLHIHAAG